MPLDEHGNVQKRSSRRLQGLAAVPDPALPPMHAPTPSPPPPPTIVHQRTPSNAEPSPRALLGGGFYTPLRTAFRRNHGKFPPTDFADGWKLRVSSAPPATGESAVGKDGDEERELWQGGLVELSDRWRSRTCRVALQCAGNRRDELSQQQPETEGIQWSSGTILNHVFTGYAVRDVLRDLGVIVPAQGPGGWHVHFESGVGADEPGGWYGCSLTLEEVMADDARPNLLAFAANGEALPLEHGQPLRLVTPGVIGARSIKWLERIRVLPYPSRNPYQTHDYKILPPSLIHPTSEEKERAMEAAPPMMAFGMSCAVLVARPGEVRGWAIGADGIPLDRIELAAVPFCSSLPLTSQPPKIREAAALLPSSSWCAAETIERGPADDGDGEREWGWVLWSSASFTTMEHDGWVVARAVDRRGRVQDQEGQWNVRGVGMCAWSVERLVERA